MENENPKGRYGAVFLSWVAGVVLPPLAVALPLLWAADARCDSGMTDCSWGLEVLLILPVLALSLVTMGPVAVRLVLGRLKDPLAGSTARWALLMVPACVPLLFLLRGPGLLFIPPLAGRYLALRRAERRRPAAKLS